MVCRPFVAVLVVAPGVRARMLKRDVLRLACRVAAHHKSVVWRFWARVETHTAFCIVWQICVIKVLLLVHVAGVRLLQGSWLPTRAVSHSLDGSHPLGVVFAS